VKKCFYTALREKEISQPVTVRTAFQLSRDGKASNLRITSGELRGSALETCLDRAFRGMTFPPSDGGPVTFPFKL
jgi:hypothetical protein